MLLAGPPAAVIDIGSQQGDQQRSQKAKAVRGAKCGAFAYPALTSHKGGAPSLWDY
jgi:hypothetical protein